MNKLIVVALLFIGITISNAQSALDVFQSESMMWYGLDFSKIKLLGPESFTDPQKIKEVYFRSMNDVIVAEIKKFNLGKFFRKSSVLVNLDVVKKNNENILVDGLISTDSKYIEFINRSMVEKLIKEYDCGTDNGLGLVFVMENFNKHEGQATASMLVTFFDIKSKKILLMERMVGKAGGFGFRNYWVGAVYKVLKQINDDGYDDWRKAYN